MPLPERICREVGQLFDLFRPIRLTMFAAGATFPLLVKRSDTRKLRRAAPDSVDFGYFGAHGET